MLVLHRRFQSQHRICEKFICFFPAHFASWLSKIEIFLKTIDFFKSHHLYTTFVFSHAPSKFERNSIITQFLRCFFNLCLLLLLNQYSVLRLHLGPSMAIYDHINDQWLVLGEARSIAGPQKLFLHGSAMVRDKFLLLRMGNMNLWVLFHYPKLTNAANYYLEHTATVQILIFHESYN